MTFEGVPGVVETHESHGETTLVIDPARLVEACRHLRDALGFNFLSDVSSVDYLGWGEAPVAGYWGDSAGRDLNRPGTTGLAHVPKPKEKRFAVNYHLLAVRSGAREAPRVRVLRRHVQQLHHPSGRGQGRPRRHPRARLPAPA